MVMEHPAHGPARSKDGSAFCDVVMAAGLVRILPLYGSFRSNVIVASVCMKCSGVLAT